jgi:hypothetical protein
VVVRLRTAASRAVTEGDCRVVGEERREFGTEIEDCSERREGGRRREASKVRRGRAEVQPPHIRQMTDPLKGSREDREENRHHWIQQRKPAQQVGH